MPKFYDGAGRRGLRLFVQWRVLIIKVVKKILKLNYSSHVVMVLGVGKVDTKGIYGCLN